MTATDQPRVHVNNLAVSFDGVPAITGISFDLYPGQCIALVGESGSGKSVTARSLLGLNGPLAQTTADGLELGGRDLSRLSPAEWRRLRGTEVGYVLQDALVSLDPLRRVGREVTETLEVHGLASRRERGGIAEGLLSRAGIPDAARRALQYPHELSGGLRQRALIASAIAASPAVLIADEPTTALDVTVQAQILELLADLTAAGTGLILVSHDLAVVSALADQIIVLSDGHVVESGTPDRVLSAPTEQYTRDLINAIPARHPVPAARPEPGEGQTPVISARDLTKSYQDPEGGRRTVLDGVSFDLHRGRTLGIVGESGSGKSTAADIVLALTEPDRGEVLLDGEPWSALRERDRRRHRTRIQRISQDPLGSFDPRENVVSILTEALAVAGVPRADRRAAAAALLGKVGLTDAVLDRSPHTLSGGQRQRVAIARALASEPEIIVCDEPVSALDVSVQAQVLALLAEVQESTGVSLLFISHDLSVVRRLADRVLVLKDGRVVESGPTAQIFDAPREDYTRALIAAIPLLPSPAAADAESDHALPALTIPVV
ncbi:MAG: dipeptide ABC transporter ATP-binding protein [Mycetocola sp.]